MIIVTQVVSDVIHGVSVETFGPFTDHSAAERYRRQLLARNTDRYLHAPQRPIVSVGSIRDAVWPWSS